MQSSRACLWVTVAISLIFVFSGQSSSAGEPLKVYVVNYPLKYFAERIGGKHVKAVLPVPAGIDPAYFVPDTETINKYQQADLILLNGAGYAKWVSKVSLPRSKMVNTSRQNMDQYITTKKVMTHSHGAAGAHAHEALAFTTWIDFSLAGQQAEAIAAALSRKRPELRDTFQMNYEALAEDLKALDRHIQAIVAKDPSTPLIGSHPVYDYVTRRYRLNMVSVHWEPDQVPGDQQWRELKKILEKHPAKWMIWEDEPVQASVDKLTSYGVNSLVFAPCGNVPDRGDFISVMRQNVDNLRLAFD